MYNTLQKKNKGEGKTYHIGDNNIEDNILKRAITYSLQSYGQYKSLIPVTNKEMTTP